MFLNFFCFSLFQVILRQGHHVGAVQLPANASATATARHRNNIQNAYATVKEVAGGQLSSNEKKALKHPIQNEYYITK